jgi:hypothetical protein
MLPQKVIVAGMYDETFAFDMQEIISDNKANSKLEPNLTIRN